jgi:hypothetical protein
MDFILWLVIGAIAGWLAGTFVRGGGYVLHEHGLNPASEVIFSKFLYHSTDPLNARKTREFRFSVTLIFSTARVANKGWVIEGPSHEIANEQNSAILG